MLGLQHARDGPASTRSSSPLFVQDSWTLARAPDHQCRRPLRAARRQPRRAVRAGRPVRAGAPLRRRSPSVIVWNNLVPRLSVAYDVIGTGRTVVKASVSQFTQRQGASARQPVQPAAPELRSAHLDGRQPRPRAAARSKSARAQGTLDRGADGSRRRRTSSRPTQWEVTASVEQQLTDNLSFTVSYFHRRYQRPHRGREHRGLGRRLHAARRSRTRSMARRSRSTARAPRRIGRVDNVLLNSDLLTQTYDGVEVTVNRRFGSEPHPVRRRHRRHATRPRSRRAAIPNDLINAAGYDPLDSPVIAEPVGHLSAARGRSAVSSHLAYYSGQPLRRVYTMSRDDRARPAPDHAGRPARADAATYRKPDQTLLDVRIGRKFRRAGSYRSSRSSRSTTC